MVDKYDEYFESQEANDDSKSDARVALILIAVFVAGMTFLDLWTVIIQTKTFLHQVQPCNQNQPR